MRTVRKVLNNGKQPTGRHALIRDDSKKIKPLKDQFYYFQIALFSFTLQPVPFFYVGYMNNVTVFFPLHHSPLLPEV